MGNVYIEPHADESPGSLSTDAYRKLKQLIELYHGWPELTRTDFGDGSSKESASADQACSIAWSIDTALPDVPRYSSYREGSKNPLAYWSGPHGRKWLRKLARVCHLGAVDFFVDVGD